MGLFSRLFGSKTSEPASAVEAEPIEYKGYFIYQEAMEEEGSIELRGGLQKK